MKPNKTDCILISTDTYIVIASIGRITDHCYYSHGEIHPQGIHDYKPEEAHYGEDVASRQAGTAVLMPQHLGSLPIAQLFLFR